MTHQQTAIRLLLLATVFLTGSLATQLCSAQYEESLFWMLDDPKIGVMLFVFEEDDITMDEYAESMAGGYVDPDIEEVTVEIGDTEFEAISVTAGDENGAYVETIIQIDAIDGTRLLILQDVLDTSRDHSEEYEALMKMMGDEFQVLEATATDF